MFAFATVATRKQIRIDISEYNIPTCVHYDIYDVFDGRV